MSSEAKTVGAAAEGDHALRHAGGLGADRDDGRARSLGDEQERVAARQPAERPELVAGDEDGAGRDPAPCQLVEQPVRGVGLVRQADLDVLGVARDPRIGQPRVASRGSRELDRLAEPAEAGRIETGLDRVQQLGDAGLGGSSHSGSGSGRSSGGSVAARRSRRGGHARRDAPRCAGGSVECLVLGGRRLPAGNQPQAVRVGDEHLGAAIHAQIEASRSFRRAPSWSSTLWTCVPVTTARPMPCAVSASTSSQSLSRLPVGRERRFRPSRR